MNRSEQIAITDYFRAGFLGALILIGVMYVLMAIGFLNQPGFVNTFRATIGSYGTWIDHPVAAFLFAISGGIWGAIFSLVPRPNPLKGAIFGLLPSLWLWLVVMPVAGGPVFGGFAPSALIMPFIFNCLIWGTFVGWYCKR